MTPKCIPVLCALLMSAFVCHIAFAAPPGQGRPPAVSVLTVTETEVNPPDEYVGRMEAIQSVDLRARVEGFLEQVAFREGGDVQEGDLLYLIEQAPYQAGVSQSKAKVAEAEATLTKARQYLKRLKAVRSGGVSATDMDTAVSAELQAKAQLQEAKAALEQAELDLGYTTITAPIGGRIGRTAYTKGNLVGPGSGALARIVQMTPIRVVYSLSERDFLDARKARNNGDGAAGDCRLVPRLELPDGAAYPFVGRIDFVDNQVDAATGTIAVRAVFDNPDGVLLPGQYVTVLVACKEGKRLPVVPQAAVQEDRDGRYVFVVDGENRVQLRRIKTGGTLDTLWAVEEGLSAGETIIVQGVQKVAPGQVVEPVPDGGQSGGQAKE